MLRRHHLAEGARGGERFGMPWASAWCTRSTSRQLVNIGVNAMVLPKQGFPLPFISAMAVRTWFYRIMGWAADQIYARVSREEEKALTTMPVRTRKKRPPRDSFLDPMNSSSQQEGTGGTVYRTWPSGEVFIRPRPPGKAHHFREEIGTRWPSCEAAESFRV